MHKIRRGFTLVEVLVALLVMAVLAAMAWQGVDGIARSRETAQSRMETTLRLNTVLAQLERDVQALHDTQGLVPPLSFDGSAVRVVRRADSGVQLVTWALRDGQLLRWAQPPVTRASELQDHWMRSQQMLGNEPGLLRALSGVTGWQLYCYRDGWSNCQSSGDITPSTTSPTHPQGEKLPDGVRFVLTLPEGSLTRIVMLGPQ